MTIDLGLTFIVALTVGSFALIPWANNIANKNDARARKARHAKRRLIRPGLLRSRYSKIGVPFASRARKIKPLLKTSTSRSAL